MMRPFSNPWTQIPPWKVCWWERKGPWNISPTARWRHWFRSIALHLLFKQEEDRNGLFLVYFYYNGKCLVSVSLQLKVSCVLVFQAGSAHVRIRRDANEQLVLAHVTNRLLPLVSTLTVQIFKDDWTRPLLSSALSSPSAASSQLPNEGYSSSSSSFPPALFPSVGGEFDPLTSTPSKPSSPPPEFSFDTPGRNVQPLVMPALGHPAHRPYGGLGLAYGSAAYTGMLGQGLMRPGVGLGLGVQGLGAGFGLSSSQSYRTPFGGSTAPLQFGTGNPTSFQLQNRQYRP